MTTQEHEIQLAHALNNSIKSFVTDMDLSMKDGELDEANKLVPKVLERLNLFKSIIDSIR